MWEEDEDDKHVVCICCESPSTAYYGGDLDV